MVSLQTVRASNSRLKDLGPGLVAVFVGGTSGIGESTAREFVRNTVQPRVYLVGRNETQASKIINELQTLNPEGQIKFVKSDVSLLRSVDAVCEEVKAHEKKVNLLFMTAGIISLKGRDETPEGLDKKFALHYYTRMRFTHNLLPLLTASQSRPLSRVISVLAPGTEGKIFVDDLALKTHFSVSQCATQAPTMTSLAAEELAAAHPGTTFTHASPGIVKTGLAREAGPIAKVGMQVLIMLLKPWSVPLTESGERHLYAATSQSFPPRDQPAESSEVGSAGIKGSGAYLLNWDGTPCGKEKILREYREKGVGKTVWEHTLEVFDKICGTDGGKY